jgi:uncharacterized protein (TIGR02118 family)
MIKVLWFLSVPAHLTVEQFEHWYLNTHTRIAKGMEGMRRYAVNRALRRQPVFIGKDQPLTHRIAEVWWDSVKAVEVCFNSPGGLADLGDGLSNMGFRGDTLPVTLFVEETEYPASEAIGFNLTTGSYLGRDFLVKLFGFVRLAEGIDFDAWYTDAASRVDQILGLRKQVYGTVSPETVRIGHVISWPPGGKPAYDRVIELWFDSVEAIDMAFASRRGKEFLEGLRQLGVTPEWVAMQNQELFFSFDANQPLEE